jgi:acetolactate synthase-1/2/3 large subunit
MQASNAGRIMRRALRVAAAERPGPVHVSCPADVAAAECTDSAVIIPPMQPVTHGVQVYAGSQTDIDKQISSAKRPVIITGTSAARADASRELVAFAEKLGCPVIVAPMGKGVFPEDHPYFAGTLDMACNAFVWDFLKTCDLILAVGFDPVELIKPWQLSAPVIHIDSTPNTDQIYTAQTEIVGAIPGILAALTAQYRGEPRWSEKEIASHRERLWELYYAGRIKGKLNPTDVVDIVREAMPRNAVATADVGSHKLLVGQGWKTYHPRGVLMTNGLSTMGYALPAAIVSGMLNPRDPTVCFVGDGGLAMVQSELRLAATLKTPITVVVFCDNSLNRIELKQMVREYPSYGTLIDATDVAAVARAMDCEGYQVSTGRELEKVLAEHRPQNRPVVIGAMIDPEQYKSQF